MKENRENRVSIHIASKNRQQPLYGCLQSLRTQTYKKFDIVLVDDCSNVPYSNDQHIALMCNKLRLENHGVLLIRNDISKGVCGARNKCIEEDKFENGYILRLDDDVICEPDFIENLIEVINTGYDVATGVTPMFGFAEFSRESRFVKPIMNKIDVDDTGKILSIGDECGYSYLDKNIIPTPHFRSNCLYKSKLKNIKYESNLSFTGFREELFWSLRVLLEGCKIGVNTKAIAWHAQAVAGGCRDQQNQYNYNVQQDQEIFNKWYEKMLEKNGNFLKKYYEGLDK